MMDKDEILERSRKENKDRDLAEDEALAQASKIAMTVGSFVCGLLTVLQAVFLNRIDYDIWTVMFSIPAAAMLAKFSRLRKRHELLLGLGYLAFAIFSFVCYLRDVLGVF